MEEKILSREVFLNIAEASGLDIKDPHIEELYSYVLTVLPGLKSLEELDLAGMEPTMPLLSPKGGQ